GEARATAGTRPGTFNLRRHRMSCGNCRGHLRRLPAICGHVPANETTSHGRVAPTRSRRGDATRRAGEVFTMSALALLRWYGGSRPEERVRGHLARSSKRGAGYGNFICLLG